jgi:hypothetical protein
VTAKPVKYTPEQDQIIIRMWGQFTTAEIAVAIGRVEPNGPKSVRQRGTERLGLPAVTVIKKIVDKQIIPVVRTTTPSVPVGRPRIEVSADQVRRIAQLRRQGATWSMIKDAVGLSEQVAHRALVEAEIAGEEERIAPSYPMASHPRLARPAWFDEPNVLAKLVSR